MSNDYLISLAEELKKTREENNISIDQIFTKTRIDRKYINAIEDGNFSIMPDVYIRAFIKEYAKAIGLDPSEVLEKFESAKEGKKFEKDDQEIKTEPIKKEDKIKKTISSAIEEDERSEVQEASFQKNNLILYIAGAIVILILIFFITKLFLEDEPNQIITEKPFEEILEERNTSAGESDNQVSADLSSSDEVPKIEQKTQTSSVPVENTVGIDQVPVIEGQLNLTIIGNDKSWMRVVSDNTDNVEFIIDKGIVKNVIAKEKFYLHIGNSGGIKLLLNNKDILFSGSPGKVRKIFVTEDGIEYLRRTPDLNAKKESDQGGPGLPE